MDFELDYDQMVLLDAEDLAEGGIAAAYESLLPRLRQYLPQPVDIAEDMDSSSGRYAIRFRDRQFLIYDSGIGAADGRSWGRAAHAFFTIVNEQLTTSPYRFYAINGGNELGGMFLTPAQAEAAKRGLPRRTDWPYLPTEEHPWYGQFH